MRSRAGTRAAQITGGVLVLQLCWVFVVPAFGGIDEVDHAFRAASVAEGYWAPPIQESPEARGTLIRVPADIVVAAQNRCEVLPYTERYNCVAASKPDARGNVLVASGASRYNPLFYAVVGAAAQPFEGATALYAMRIASCLLCAGLIGAALLVTSRAGRSLWPTAAILLALTPVFLYATSVVAPNGVQFAGALLMWTCALALAQARLREGPLLVGLGVGVAAVVLTHSTGPLWVGIAALVITMTWPRRVVELWHTHRAQLLAFCAWSAVVLLAGLSWTLTRRANLSGDVTENAPELRTRDLLLGLISWSFQTVGALPFRNEYLPVPVLAISVVPFAGIVVLALVQASRVQRLAMVAVAVVTLAIPVVFTVLTHATLGYVWQGRYGLPVALGLLTIAAWVLDRRHRPGARRNVFLPIAIAAFVLTQTIAMIVVLGRQRGSWPPAESASPPPGWLLLVLAGMAAGLVLAGARADLARALRPLPEPKP